MSRQWIVLLQEKSRNEYPTIMVFEGTTEEGHDLEQRIRALFEHGAIKNFVFEPIDGTVQYDRLSNHLSTIEKKVTPWRR